MLPLSGRRVEATACVEMNTGDLIFIGKKTARYPLCQYK